ncbi:hypothetical protein M407DRAFT_28856 [Tulasnella calospora MUT 4182]|uniref:Uncharacterized protein n=1 Tax=Tulasnella calospora MUT 4182 TaxID=1051891 RepID=A0A0C3Q0P1_9AGAM|nr:hypothetical protein M407DRAFT_28856 [Tulasnella calospora MUT 4182]
MAQDKNLEDSPPPTYKAALPVVHVVRYEIASSTDPISASVHGFPSSTQPHHNDQALTSHLASTPTSVHAHGNPASSQSGAHGKHAPSCSICLHPQATSLVHLTHRHSICASHSKEFARSFRRWSRDYPELAGGSIADLLRAGPGVSLLEYQLNNYFAFAEAQQQDTESEEENTALSSGSSPFLKSPHAPLGSFVEDTSGDLGAAPAPVAVTGADNIQSTTAMQTSPSAAPLQELPSSPATQPSVALSIPTPSIAHPNSPSSASSDSSSGSSYRSYLAWSKSEMEEAIRLTEEQEAIWFGQDSYNDVHMRGSSDED